MLFRPVEVIRLQSKFQERGFYQQCNGIQVSQLNEDDRRASEVAQQAAQPLPTKAFAVPRRNRRKADLTQETSAQEDDDDELTVATFAAAQSNFSS